ncbi:hypothetical protein BH11MYX3_BH11MYX3_01940 [soil metagenome]
MQVELVEVIASIADSIVHIAHVPSNGRYRIGTGAEVELAVAAGKLHCFPVLDEGFVVRRPAGLEATLHIDGVAHPMSETELRLQPGWRIELALGAATLSLALIARPRIAVPLRRTDLRPLGYIAVVLVAHLMVWAAAMWFQPIERLGVEVVELERPPTVRLTHVEEPPPPPPAKAVKNAATSPPPSGTSAPRRDELPRDPKARAIQSARKGGGMMASLSDLSSLVPKVNVKKLVDEAVFYDEGTATAGQFGNSRRFDPTKHCTDCGTVATGTYATVSSGDGAGDSYDLPGAARHQQPIIAPCEPSGCKIVGETSVAVVRHEVDLRIGAFGYCHQRFALKQQNGTMVIAFSIGADGTVRDARAKGMPEINDCVAKVFEVIPFPPQAAGTQVTYPLMFTAR